MQNQSVLEADRFLAVESSRPSTTTQAAVGSQENQTRPSEAAVQPQNITRPFETQSSTQMLALERAGINHDCAIPAAYKSDSRIDTMVSAANADASIASTANTSTSAPKVAVAKQIPAKQVCGGLDLDISTSAQPNDDINLESAVVSEPQVRENPEITTPEPQKRFSSLIDTASFYSKDTNISEWEKKVIDQKVSEILENVDTSKYLLIIRCTQNPQNR